jgi:hypothetical protein
MALWPVQNAGLHIKKGDAQRGARLIGLSRPFARFSRENRINRFRRGQSLRGVGTVNAILEQSGPYPATDENCPRPSTPILRHLPGRSLTTL